MDAQAKRLEYDPKSPPLLRFSAALAAFSDGSDTPRAYLERCLATIAEYEPAILAFVHRDDGGARQAADAATERYKQGKPLSLIDGCPMAIKDIIETADMPTQMNSAIYSGWQSERDAASVYALRESGAVIVGKTVTTEFAAGASGPTRNPFDPNRTPGGSSSGTAAAVGSGMLPAGLGTQTGGSVVRPAAYCGAYGFKPTHAALNMGGIHPISNSHDTLGTIAGSVEDCWRVAYQIAQLVGGTAPHPGMRGPAALAEAVRPARLIRLYTDGWQEVEAAPRDAFERLIQHLEQKGVDIVDRKDGDEIAKLEQLLQGVEVVARTITAYERRWPYFDYYKRYPSKLSPNLCDNLERSFDVSMQGFQAAIEKRVAIRHQVATLGAAADGFITFTAAGPAPLGLESTGNRSFQICWTLTGAPSFTLPLLCVDGLPLGVQCMGFVDQDERLARHAKWVAETILGLSGD
jgi:Asp-tRNA(Asn)/Glu-tRNA(Gln) amidotransferase A subunit family amidase